MTEETTNSTALLPLEKKNAAEYFRPRGLDPIIDKIRSEVEAFKGDMSTAGGRKEIASFAYKLAQSKTALDKFGKDLVAGIKEQAKQIDAERSRAWDAIEQMQREVRSPLTEWEEAEKARISGHEHALLLIGAVGSTATTSGEFIDSIAELKKYYDHDWHEFKERAYAAIAQRESILISYCDREKKAESDRAELERLRKEEEARKQKERDEQLQREAAEAARKEAEEKAEREKRAIEARVVEEKQRAEKAERDKIEAVERAAAEERQRIEDEQAKIAAETARREADKEHRAKINREALDSIINGIPKEVIENGGVEDYARAVIEAIAKGQIPHVKIIY